ncbi:MAG: hypothetical protein Tsb0032_03080 [Kiloniellaceae bacterium]
MNLWMIAPAAPLNDSRWLNFPQWTEVVVRAQTAAEARMLAGRMEQRLDADLTPTGNESHPFRSGFEDEKLYHVRRLEPRELPDTAAKGPPEVLHARQVTETP